MQTINTSQTTMPSFPQCLALHWEHYNYPDVIEQQAILS